MELTEGATVWLAAAYVTAGATEVKVYVSEATVYSVEAKVMKVGGSYRQMYYSEQTFATEAEARSWAAAQLEAIAERVSAVARAEREKAAAVTAKGAVVYA